METNNFDDINYPWHFGRGIGERERNGFGGSD